MLFCFLLRYFVHEWVRILASLQLDAVYISAVYVIRMVGVVVRCRQILVSSVDAEEGNELRRRVPYLLAQPPWNDDSALRNNLTVSCIDQ